MSFFENLSRKLKFCKNLTRITVTSHEDVFTFMTICRLFLLRMRNISDKSCRENQNTHFVFSNFFPKNRAIYEIVSKNMMEPERPQTMSQNCIYAFNAG
jgi:hypothetical protein